jgi:hypothetical protein
MKLEERRAFEQMLNAVQALTAALILISKQIADVLESAHVRVAKAREEIDKQ